MKHLLQFFICAPIAIVLIALSVANRGPVILSFDPFSTTDPALFIAVPLFWLIFGNLILGALIGGSIVWMKQGRFRREAREQKYEAARARSEARQARSAESGIPPAAAKLLAATKPS